MSRDRERPAALLIGSWLYIIQPFSLSLLSADHIVCYHTLFRSLVFLSAHPSPFLSFYPPSPFRGRAINNGKPVVVFLSLFFFFLKKRTFTVGESWANNGGPNRRWGLLCCSNVQIQTLLLLRRQRESVLGILLLVAISIDVLLIVVVEKKLARVQLSKNFFTLAADFVCRERTFIAWPCCHGRSGVFFLSFFLSLL